MTRRAAFLYKLTIHCDRSMLFSCDILLANSVEKDLSFISFQFFSLIAIGLREEDDYKTVETVVRTWDFLEDGPFLAAKKCTFLPNHDQ